MKKIHTHTYIYITAILILISIPYAKEITKVVFCLYRKVGPTNSQCVVGAVFVYQADALT